MARILELEDQDETFWAQRPRVRWLQAGDSNTTFFHHSTIQKKMENSITKIKDDCGNWMEELLGVKRSFEVHFRNLFWFSGNHDWGTSLIVSVRQSPLR